MSKPDSTPENEKLWNASAGTDNAAAAQSAIDNGANIHCTDSDGYTPFHMAVACNKVKVLRLLLGHPDIQINQQDRYGWTALHSAAAYGHVECVRELLAAKANTQIKNKHVGKTALDVARSEGNSSVISLLEDYERNPHKYHAKSPSQSAASASSNSRDLENELKEREEEIEALKKELGRTEQELDATHTRADRAEQERDAANRKLGRIGQERDAALAHVAAVEEEMARVQKQHDAIAKHMPEEGKHDDGDGMANGLVLSVDSLSSLPLTRAVPVREWNSVLIWAWMVQSQKKKEYAQMVMDELCAFPPGKLHQLTGAKLLSMDDPDQLSAFLGNKPISARFWGAIKDLQLRASQEHEPGMGATAEEGEL